jgi:hypothetical protein
MVALPRQRRRRPDTQEKLKEYARAELQLPKTDGIEAQIGESSIFSCCCFPTQAGVAL